MDYKEKLKLAKEALDSGSYDKETIEYIFPELKGSTESEDERIRKELLNAFKEATDSIYMLLTPSKREAFIAWLEKQGEQKSIWHNEDEEPKRGSLILLIMQSGTPIVAKIIEPNHTFNHGERWAYIDDLLEKQGEQKDIPADAVLDGNKDGLIADTIRCKREKQDEQKPAEWSEDVEAAISLLKHIAEEQEKDYCPYNANNLRKAAQYLETCRPQSTWKPNDEQMEAVKCAALDVAKFSQRSEQLRLENDSYYKALISLYEQLKKLREEDV